MIIKKTGQEQSYQGEYKYLIQKNTGPNDSSKDSQSDQTIDKFEQNYEQNPQEINIPDISNSWQKLMINNHNQQSTQFFEKQSPQIQAKNSIGIYDKAEAVKKNFLKKLDIFMDQIYIFEDQYYLTKDSCDQYHPNCLADNCLENIEKITDLIEKTIKQIEKVSGNKQKTKFHYTDDTQYFTKFENLQGQEYQLQFIQFYEQTIVAYDCSIKDKILACCFNNTIALFDMKLLEDICKINHLREITAIKFYEDDSFNFIVGDIKGFVVQYIIIIKQYLYQLHSLIYQFGMFQKVQQYQHQALISKKTNLLPFNYHQILNRFQQIYSDYIQYCFFKQNMIQKSLYQLNRLNYITQQKSVQISNGVLMIHHLFISIRVLLIQEIQNGKIYLSYFKKFQIVEKIIYSKEDL